MQQTKALAEKPDDTYPEILDVTAFAEGLERIAEGLERIAADHPADKDARRAAVLAYIKAASQEGRAKAREILKGQVAVAAYDAKGAPVDATSLQIAGALDDLYAYAGPLGVTYAGDTPTLRVWAPTARSVISTPSRWSISCCSSSASSGGSRCQWRGRKRASR